MSILYALQHLDYSIPPEADAGWIGEVGSGPSHLNEDSREPENVFTNRNTTIMNLNLTHQDFLLQKHSIPPYGNQRTALDNRENGHGVTGKQ